MSGPSWGTSQPVPTIKPSDVTVGSKGRIIMSTNIVTKPGQPASSGGAPQSMEK